MSFQQQQPGSTPHMSERPTEGKQDSFAKDMGKKYAGGAAKEAGKQTEDYVMKNHDELGQDASGEYDQAKARAQEQLDEAKQTWAKIFPCCAS